ncbi:ACP S-malonyltransferase [Streptomyces viridiviolaceus]
MTPDRPVPAGGGPRTVLMCPGQGAYVPGALRHLRDHPAVRGVLQAVDAGTPGPVSTVAPVSRLLTEDGAPAPGELLAAGPLAFDLATYSCVVASATVLLTLTHTPVDAVLGHSMGDLAALTVAGVITVHQGAALLGVRDRLLREAALPPAGLLAIDMTDDQAARLIRTCGTPQVRIAARNAPAQTVLAGPDDDLALVRHGAHARGHRATPLTSRTAYHHPLLTEVQRAFRGLLRAQPVKPPALAVYTAAGRRAHTPAQLRTTAACHLAEPMDFRQALHTMHGAGFTTYIDSGPRAVLSALAKANLPACAAAAPQRTPADARRIRDRLTVALGAAAVLPGQRSAPAPRSQAGADGGN